jgi:hypothetical protein
MGNIAMVRAMKPWLYPDILFVVTALKRLQTKCLDVLHHTTNSVIWTRKQDLLAEAQAKGAEQREKNEFGNYSSFSVHVDNSDSGCGHGAEPRSEPYPELGGSRLTLIL